MEKLHADGKIRAIGVSNFLVHHLDRLLNKASIVPAVNQVEFHPYLIQQDLLDYCRSKGIEVEGWSPLMQGRFRKESLFSDLSDKYQKTEAQVLLRWHIQQGVITIPKSVNRSRISENLQIFDFEIADDDMSRISALDKRHRFGPDPDNFDF